MDAPERPAPGQWGARRLVRRPAVPPILLLLALSSVFLFGGERGNFYRPVQHDWVSSEHLAIARNLSPEHGLLLFHHQITNLEGAPGYSPYSRFPLGGYALLNLTTLPFRDDLSAQILAARMLMLTFFAGAAVLAYLALARLISGESKRWIALTATLLTFSSPYFLFYNDVTAPEISMDLFGVLLVFHGIAVFAESGRFAQLVVKGCAALLLGWHVFALLLAFIVLGAASALVLPSRWSLLGRYLVLGCATLLVGATILTLNLANERRALGGELALAEVPSFRSALFRTGIAPSPWVDTGEFEWGPFLELQFRRIGGGISLPFSLAARVHEAAATRPVERWGPRGATIGQVVTGLCFASLIGLGLTGRLRHALPLASLPVAGFFWALPMRNNTLHHEFEAIWYLGIPLVLFGLGLLGLRRLAGVRVLVGVAIAALLLFWSSAGEMGRVGVDGGAASFQEEIVADFEAIRQITRGGSVTATARGGGPALIPFAGARHGVNFYLTGSPLLYNALLDGADFLIARDRDGPVPTLTPDNRSMFLYDAGDLTRDFRSRYWSLRTGGPSARSRFEVYLRDGSLSFVREDCQPRDLDAPFFVDLERPSRDSVEQHGFHFFDEFGLLSSGVCLVTVPLPDARIARITTGQRDGDQSWEVAFDPE